MSVHGKTVVLTRPEEQGHRLSERLRDVGARVLNVPAIRFVATDDLRSWREALESWHSYTHLVFTSQVAARFFIDFSLAAGHPVERWRRCRIAVIGARAGEILAAAGLEPDFVAGAGRGVDFASALIEREEIRPGCRILLPQSAIARPEVADLLEAAGAAVDAVTLYETIPEEASRAAPLLEALDAGEHVDAILFASPSAVRAFLEMTGPRGQRMLGDRSVRVISIGPTTSQALRDLGLRVDVEARSPDANALLDSVVAALAEED